MRPSLEQRNEPREDDELAKRILQQNSLAQHWAQDWVRDWRALALTQVHHWSRLSDSGEDGKALELRALDRPRRWQKNLRRFSAEFCKKRV